MDQVLSRDLVSMDQVAWPPRRHNMLLQMNGTASFRAPPDKRKKTPRQTELERGLKSKLKICECCYCFGEGGDPELPDRIPDTRNRHPILPETENCLRSTRVFLSHHPNLLS